MKVHRYLNTDRDGGKNPPMVSTALRSKLTLGFRSTREEQRYDSWHQQKNRDFRSQDMSEFKSINSGEEMEMDAEYKEAAAGSQSALQFAAISEAEKRIFRDELTKYLEDMKEKLGSDGEKLVHASEEFDTVAEAMTRQDLLSDESAPWSKYLLSNDRSFERSLGEAGRYNNVSIDEMDEGAASEAKIRKEMARMELLEKQLRLASKKDAFVRRELIELEYEQEGSNYANDDDDDAMSESSRASSTHSNSTKKSGKSNRSVLSRFNDYTFLTRAKSDRSASRGSDLQSFPNSPMLSARSVESEPESRDKEGKDEDAILTTPERMRARAERRAKNEKAADELKKKALKGRSALSDDEELRVKNLLDVDERSEAWESLSIYGTASQKAILESYDEKLRAYGRLDRLDEVEEAKAEAVTQAAAAAATGTTKERQDNDDYLSVQRVIKDRARRLDKIEGMLKTVTGDVIDLSGLVDKEAPTASRAPGVVEERGLLQVPSFDFVKSHPGRKVTNADIAKLLVEIKGLKQEIEETGVEHKEPQSEDTKEGASSRREIDRLLGDLRPEIERLGNLRKALHEVMSGSPEERHESRMTNNAIQKALMDLDDELIDMQNLYGTASAAAKRAPKANIAGKTLEPMSEQRGLHAKLRKLRDRMAERGIYQQDYNISNASADRLDINEDDAPPPPNSAATQSNIGFDARFRRPVPLAPERDNEHGEELLEQDIHAATRSSPEIEQGKLVV